MSDTELQLRIATTAHATYLLKQAMAAIEDLRFEAAITHTEKARTQLRRLAGIEEEDKWA